MIVRTGDVAKELLSEAERLRYMYADANVYDYHVENGMVLIRRNSKECLYIKASGRTKGRKIIALQGMPEEFFKYRAQVEQRFTEAEIIDWEEIKEMVKWAPNVPAFY